MAKVGDKIKLITHDYGTPGTIIELKMGPDRINPTYLGFRCQCGCNDLFVPYENSTNYYLLESIQTKFDNSLEKELYEIETMGYKYECT